MPLVIPFLVPTHRGWYKDTSDTFNPFIIEKNPQIGSIRIIFEDFVVAECVNEQDLLNDLNILKGILETVVN